MCRLHRKTGGYETIRNCPEEEEEEELMMYEEEEGEQ